MARKGPARQHSREERPQPKPVIEDQSADSPEGERLQKVLARAGFGSRRFCETLITQGRVSVDGEVVRELGVRVDARNNRIEVNGEAIRMPKRDVYLAVYKPRGVLSDAGSPDDDVPTILEMAPEDSGHLFPIGRLDLRSEGLVLLTSDGDVTHRLTHPRFEHAKVYYVLVEKRPTETELYRLRTGIELEDGVTAPAKVEVVETLPAELKLDPGPQRGVWLRFELTEGKKRQLRHMTAAVGLPTLRLIRWAIGPLALRDMAPKSVRFLTAVEIQKLRLYAGLPAGNAGERKPARTRRTGRATGGARGPARSSTRGRRSPNLSLQGGDARRSGAPGKRGAANAGAGNARSAEGRNPKARATQNRTNPRPSRKR